MPKSKRGITNLCMAKAADNCYSKPLSKYELRRHVIRFSNKLFGDLDKPSSINVEIKGKVTSLHVDKFGRAYIGNELFSGIGIERSKKPTLLITKMAHTYKLEIV